MPRKFIIFALSYAFRRKDKLLRYLTSEKWLRNSFRWEVLVREKQEGRAADK